MMFKRPANRQSSTADPSPIADRRYVVTMRVGRSKRYYSGATTNTLTAQRAALKHFRELYPKREVEVVSLRQL
jgi:hypothetical protein